MEPKIEVENLSFHYSGRPSLFDGIELSIGAGEFVGLIGPNGAGKTTLLELVYGNLKPHSGHVRLYSVEAASRNPVERARAAACLPQRLYTSGSSTVFDIVMSGRRPYRGLGGFSSEDEELALDAAKRLGVDAWLDRRSSELSGGEFQRVLVARAIAQAAPVLLCDEPASSLDPKHLWATFRLLRDLAHDDGVAVLASVHDLSLAATLCDRIVLLADGKILHDGTALSLDDTMLSRAYDVEVQTIRTKTGVFFTYGQG